MVYTLGCTQGGVYLRMYQEEVYTSLYALSVYQEECMPPVYPTILPWVHPSHRWSSYYTPGVLHGVYGEEALGSTGRITVGERLPRASFLPFLLGLLCPGAQSYSALPVNN